MKGIETKIKINLYENNDDFNCIRDGILGGFRWEVSGLIENLSLINKNIKETPDKVIVSCANSYGYMDGGSDLAIMQKLPGIQEKVKEEIKKRYGRVNPVGNPLLVEFKGHKIISVPTMVTHRRKVEVEVICMCYLNLFLFLMYNNIKEVSMCLFGAGYNGSSALSSFGEMYTAYGKACAIIEEMDRGKNELRQI